MDIQIGDIITMKKKHPCGSAQWKVLRIGADFRLECAGCGHQIMIARTQAEKNLRGWFRDGAEIRRDTKTAVMQRESSAE